MLEPVTSSVMSKASSNPFSTKRIRVVELVGPAGAGKSSLLRLLSQYDKSIQTRLDLSLSQYMKWALLLQPNFFRIHNPYRRFLWKEMKRILYLEVLHEALQHQVSNKRGPIILDEGPIYMLSRLRVFGGDVVDTISFQRWWSTAISRWASTVDAIVWLDAENPILSFRIRTREQQRPINDPSDSALFKFFARYRAAFERVITELTAGAGPRVIKFSTDRESLEQIAERVLLQVGRM